MVLTANQLILYLYASQTIENGKENAMKNWLYYTMQKKKFFQILGANLLIVSNMFKLQSEIYLHLICMYVLCGHGNAFLPFKDTISVGTKS